MNRREAIQRATLMLGGVLSAPLMAGAMGQILNTGESLKVSSVQEALLAEVADIIIPTTKTPGAKAAGVEKFIVRVVRDCFEKPEQEKFYAGLTKLDADSQAKFGKGFTDLSLEQKNEMIKQTTVDNKPFFVQMKGLTVTGYFTSEIGATQALDYVAIPGKFEACIPMAADKKLGHYNFFKIWDFRYKNNSLASRISNLISNTNKTMANLNIDSIKDQTYDAIVVGSGISGGWAAKELTEKGLRVLMLEKGKQLEHVTGYENAMKDPWQSQYNGRLTVEQKASHPKLARDYPYNEMTEKYWMNDSDALYKEDKRFDWFRPNIVGGKSIMWGRQSYRLSDIDFEANLKDGIAVDWPIRYKDIAPWYSYVEKFAGISGEKLGLPQLPDSDFLPPMEMYCVEKEVRKRLEKNFPGRVMTIGRVANLSEARKEQLGVGRAACQYRNKCSLGCPFGAYFSTQSCTLPPAAKTGRLTLRPDSIVKEIIYDESKNKATGVRVIDAVTMDVREYFAKVIFVCGSTLGSTTLMLNSKSNRFPNGFGNDSGQLGHNLMDHHFRTGASGEWEGDLDKYYYGRRANGIYVPRYRNIGNDKRDYLRGFGYQGGGSRQGWQRNVAELSFGADFKEELTKPGMWTMGFGGFGETLPYYENRVYLHPTEKDKWGLPLPIFDAELKENEKKMRVDMLNDAVEMLEKSGLKNVKGYDRGSYLGMAIHEMGTARMGRDPKTSVLNANNQVHAVKNVFVTDGSCMTSASCVNPSLTYMALTARAAHFAVAELKKKNL